MIEKSSREQLKKEERNTFTLPSFRDPDGVATAVAAVLSFLYTAAVLAVKLLVIEELN